MFGTVQYFTDCFKTCIMNNFIIERPFTLHSYYEHQLNEIMGRSEINNEKDIFSSNLEKAYKNIREELFGDRRME
ncbi:hypothetical protein [Bacillus sp. 1P06AnD]|uniref:hypothetical protein n=1 Tax=Bacillus sp. 1P06AnD TaxID=3132208 RepID=UPI0039A1F632